MQSSFNTVIIGAGIAGMTAAMYLKRANIDFILIEKSAPGGQINRSSNIENYPGLQNIDGPTLSMNLYEQITNLNIDIKFGEVTDIKLNNNKKQVFLNNEIIECDNIILAVGRTPKELGLENEKSLTGHGVSWCALCDGFFYKNKDVAVVGGGNSAFEEALYLSNICNKVYILNRSNKFRARNNIIEKAKSKENIIIKENVTITKLITENEYLNKLELNNNEELDVKGLFIYIGSNPEIKFLKNLNLDIENEYLIVNKDMQTNIEGIYACGDIVKKNVYQLTTAVGEASTAANSIIFKSNIK